MYLLIVFSFVNFLFNILLGMDEQPKQSTANKDSPKKVQKRRKRVTVAEKLVQGRNGRTNHQSDRSKQSKPSKNGDKRGERAEKEVNKKRNDGIDRSNSEERKKVEGRVDRTLPDRWLTYPIAINQPVENTRFLAFKTPLGALFFEGKKFRDRQQHRFEVNTVIRHVNSLKKSLGLVIDLTNTDRYYDFDLWSEHKVKYVKIRCPGHQVSESEEFYERFQKEVKQFIQQHKNTDKLVGVHCTHGLNRTGYMICRYLIEEFGWSAINAIEGFRLARGYPMERPKYIESLKEVEKKLERLKVNGSSSA